MCCLSLIRSKPQLAINTSKRKASTSDKLINLDQNGRQLKVYSKYFLRSDRRGVIFPEIRLCGKWLRDLGFDFGQAVIVKQEKNKIIITINHNNNDKMP